MTKLEKSDTTIGCCPPEERDTTCDVLTFHYRLTHDAQIRVGARRQLLHVPVEVKLNFQLTRCPGPTVIGDIAYTTTLLPGEKVRLFTSDRRTRFTFDSTTQLSYRNSQSSEESFYMQSMSDFMSDLHSRDDQHSSNTSHAHVDGHADAGVDLLGMGGSANMSGNYDANSTSDFLRETTQHAVASHHASEQGTRKASSVSVGEVQTRSHTETSSEDHYESSSREFTNPNKCHAVTFLFYRINKLQTVKLTLESIERRVMMDPDPDKDFTKVTNRPLTQSTGVGVISDNVLATNLKRNEITSMARSSITLDTNPSLTVGAPQTVSLDVSTRQAALKQIDQQLVNEGLLDKVGGNVSPEAQAKYSFERESSLPTPGLIVKGCLDECDICEPTLHKQIELDIEKQKLQNDLLKRQIDLLDKAQEYRCCPPAPIVEES